MNGTARYDAIDPATLPDLVNRALSAARELDFPFCVHPATGRLLQTLAAAVPPLGLVGETGTGTGVGLAWMASRADPATQLVSVEIDADLATAAQRVFADTPNVTVLHADAGELFDRGPYDLLVHDGGWGTGKMGGDRVDETDVLTEGGLMTIDDFTPMTGWPPTFNGEPDEARIYWLTRPNLLSTEIRVAPDMAVIVGRLTSRA